ncbi:dihydrofolate reductase [Thermophagus xiamenensis]|uniref:Dihydrofolate reductase n=1 Tax=Thermophagus xiamenensis TaxID=385682 RepID=A0A1I2CKV8_9BACT|nr:dihydrofolate reductase [Thermophagus xiamenensis]SFE68977.1 dihydrofolate reductase [Thermophagus xiamenensis]
MVLSLIVVVDENNGIGINGTQPAYIRDDLKRFKELTVGNTIVMGRKTFQALPKGALPNRRNVVLTRQQHFIADKCEIIHSPDELYNLCAPEEKVFVIGGGDIYRLFLSKANYIYLTLIHYRFEEIDTWFPKISEELWRIEIREGPFTDVKSGFSYSYINYIRR